MSTCSSGKDSNPYQDPDLIEEDYDEEDPGVSCNLTIES